MRWHIIIATCLVLASGTAYAQDEFKNPVKNENRLKSDLFELKPYEYNHIFQVVMPGDNFLLVDFYRMSYWPDTAVLHTIFDIAAKAAAQAQDSFPSAITSKRIDVHVPVKDRPLQLRLNDHNDGTDMLVLNYDQQTPLKLGMDTIRIFKTLDVSKDKYGEEIRKEIQYTFILKDLGDMQELNNNKELVANMARTFDSVVQYRRSRWHNEDVWYHEVGLRYTPLETDKDKQLEVKKRPGFFKAVDADYHLGASLFRNTLCPYLEVGASYKWPGDIGEYDYVKVSLSGLAMFERQSEKKYDYYSTSIASIEFGTLVNKSDTWLPLYETSIGIGYLFSEHPSISPYKGFKVFWHYSIAPAVRITPEIYGIIRKGQDNLAFAGLTVSVKFF